MSTEVNVSDAEVFQKGFDSIRSDDSSINWLLVGHEDDNVNMIYLEGTGSGGLEELVDRLMDSKMQYALVRLTEIIDMSTTIKFVYIRWQGTGVPFVQKGKYGVLSGSVESFFRNYHCAIETDSRSDLVEENVMTKLQEQSGTKSKVLDASVGKTRPERGFVASSAALPTQTSHVDKVNKTGCSFTGMTGMAMASGGLKIDAQVTEAVARVIKDEDDAMWCTAGYEGNNPKSDLKLLEIGETDLDEFVSEFTAEDLLDKVIYGYVKVADEVDGIKTMKFATLYWVGENTKPMTKAKVSTHKGALEACFKPSHVSITANLPSEATVKIILDKVSSASGSKSHIIS